MEDGFHMTHTNINNLTHFVMNLSRFSYHSSLIIIIFFPDKISILYKAGSTLLKILKILGGC